MSIHTELLRISWAITLNRERLTAARDERNPVVSAALAIHALNVITEGTWNMAKKISESKGKKKSKAEFAGFANIELTVEQKAEAKEWIKNVENVQIELDELAASLYKVSFFKSDATGGYQATAYCNDDKSVNAGYILSAFAPHWWDALGMLAFKHAVVAEGIWPIDEDTRGDIWG